MKKILFTASILLYIFCFSFILTSKAAFLDDGVIANMQENTGVVQTTAGYGDTTLGEVVATVIKGFLGLLGIIFIVLIILSGYNWMTAAGDEEKIKKATSTIRSAIIGLLIIIAAYAITYFVFQNLPGSGAGYSPPG